MSVAIPEKFHDLFSRRLLCALTTMNPDGQPHTVPVWCDFDGEHVRVNLRIGTKKVRNIRSNSKLTLLVLDSENPGHWIEIQGQVGEFRDEAHGSLDHINQLSEKYDGKPYGYSAPGRNDRLMVIVEATKVNGN